MNLTLRVLVVIIIAVLVVVALFGVASGILSQAGDTVTGSADNQTDILDCVLQSSELGIEDDCRNTGLESSSREAYQV